MRSDDSSELSPPARTSPPADRPPTRYCLLLDDGSPVPADVTPEQVNWLKSAGCIVLGSMRPTPLAEATRPILITEIGVGLVDSYLKGFPQTDNPRMRAEQLIAALALMADRPLWINNNGQLWYHGELLKQFADEAVNQRPILNAFQASGWQSRIVNPLAALMKEYGSTLFHDALRELREGQKPRRLWFYSDRQGGVCWKVL